MSDGLPTSVAIYEHIREDCSMYILPVSVAGYDDASNDADIVVQNG